MLKLTIDNMQIEVEYGTTILTAAEKLGIDIPTMCFMKEIEPLTSCMICVVQVEGYERLLPACGTLAQDDMIVTTNSPKVIQTRRTCLELLLSDHLGDCMGPCQIACPAKMNIPLMIRQIAAGDLASAIATVKKDIALPAVLGRICPAPCEKVCRRSQVDQPVSICLLKKFAADIDLESDKPFQPSCLPDCGKKVAVVGAGPAGLSAAYYLLQQGISCTVFDDHPEPGGMLRYGIDRQILPLDILDSEIELIKKLGMIFMPDTKIDDSVVLADLQKDFDAVLIAAGQRQENADSYLGLKTTPNGLLADRKTFQTSQLGVFAAGDIVSPRKMAVSSLANGKKAAVAIIQFLSGSTFSDPDNNFNTRIGPIRADEINQFMTGIDSSPQVVPVTQQGGFTDAEAKTEASRCMHCDCRKADNCKLREYANIYEARPGRYKTERNSFVCFHDHPEVIYEPGKCINCGLCVKITEKYSEPLGLAFVGRGFNVRPKVPFNETLTEGLKIVAAKCAQACPTGALVLKS